MNKNWKDIDKLISNSNRIVLSTHEKPDGDGLCSGIAFYYYLKNLKKDTRFIQPSPFPEQYKIIDPDSIVETYSDDCKSWIESADLLILFDIGNYKRARNASKGPCTAPTEFCKYAIFSQCSSIAHTAIPPTISE